MKYLDLCTLLLPKLKGIGDEANEEVFLSAQKRRPVCIAKHKCFVRDEHDRFMPTYFNGINMPVNIKD